LKDKNNNKEEDKENKGISKDMQNHKKKSEISVKYEYQQPNNELKMIIPFCNNFFIIQEND
jgi:hypothetical protein